MEKFIQRYFSFFICILLYVSFSGHVVGVLGAVNQHSTRGNEKNIETPNRGNYNKSVFNVKDFGAKGDGITDDSKAFQAAIAKACEVKDSVMLVPSGFTFLLQPITFMGNSCQPNFTFQVDGIIAAPSDTSKWNNVDRQWILFTFFIKGITIRGNGVIDGHGEAWWAQPAFDEDNYKNRIVSYLHNLLGDIKDGTAKANSPHAIYISNSNNVTVTGITIKNSPRMHIFFSQCQQVKIFNFTLTSPKESPNTDGIHLSRTQHVDIHNSTLACGDDCISIQTGSSDVKIYDVHCGPGHGYSIGGLGFDKTQAQVSDVAVYNSTVENSLTGVRIKTWKGGSGYVRNVTFSNITMTDVHRPISIDQNYCNGKKNCPSDDKNALTISNVTYENIVGTYSFLPLSIVCSEYKPCQNITMKNINLTPLLPQVTGSGGSTIPVCSNAFGEVITMTTPPLQDCLMSEGAEAPMPAKTRAKAN